MSTVSFELDHLWRGNENLGAFTARKHPQWGLMLTPTAVMDRSRLADLWLARNLAQYELEVKTLEMMEIDHQARIREKKDELQSLEEQIREAEEWRLAVDKASLYMLENKHVVALPEASSPGAQGESPSRRSHLGDAVAESPRKVATAVSPEKTQYRIQIKEAKSFQLLISCAIALGICLASLAMAIEAITGYAFGVSAHFWFPIAIGTFGVAGSNYLYLRRLWR